MSKSFAVFAMVGLQGIAWVAGAKTRVGAVQTKGASPISSKKATASKRKPVGAPVQKAELPKLPDLAQLWGKGQIATVKSRGETRNSLKFYDLRLEEMRPPEPGPSGKPAAPAAIRRYTLAGRSPFKSQASSEFKMLVTQTPRGVTATSDIWGTEPVPKEDDDAGRIVFVHPKSQVTLTPVLNETFVPTRFHAVAYAGATVIKRRNYTDVAADLPLSRDGVLALAEDELGRCKGVFKFPAWDYVISLNGVVHQGEFLLESDAPGNHAGKWIVKLNSYSPDHPGLIGPRPYVNKHLRIRWSASGLSVSCDEDPGQRFDWGHDLHEQSSASAEVDAAKLRPLEPLRALHEKNWQRSLWVRGDDADSFLEAADRAVAESGLAIHLPDHYIGGHIKGDDHRNGGATGSLLARRVAAAGLKTIPWRVSK